MSRRKRNLYFAGLKKSPHVFHLGSRQFGRINSPDSLSHPWRNKNGAHTFSHPAQQSAGPGGTKSETPAGKSRNYKGEFKISKCSVDVWALFLLPIKKLVKLMSWPTWSATICGPWHGSQYLQKSYNCQSPSLTVTISCFQSPLHCRLACLIDHDSVADEAVEADGRRHQACDLGLTVCYRFKRPTLILIGRNRPLTDANGTSGQIPVVLRELFPWRRRLSHGSALVGPCSRARE